MVVAGAPPPGSPEDIYARFARKAQAAGAAVLIDARREVLMQALSCSPMLVKLNDQELAATCGRPIDTEGRLREAAQILISGGARWVLVTQAKQDAWLLNETLVWRFTPPAVHVLNTVGAVTPQPRASLPDSSAVNPCRMPCSLGLPAVPQVLRHSTPATWMPIW